MVCQYEFHTKSTPHQKEGRAEAEGGRQDRQPQGKGGRERGIEMGMDGVAYSGGVAYYVFGARRASLFKNQKTIQKSWFVNRNFTHSIEPPKFRHPCSPSPSLSL